MCSGFLLYYAYRDKLDFNPETDLHLILERQPERIEVLCLHLLHWASNSNCTPMLLAIAHDLKHYLLTVFAAVAEKLLFQDFVSWEILEIPGKLMNNFLLGEQEKIKCFPKMKVFHSMKHATNFINK